MISFGHGVALGPIEPQYLEMMRAWRNNFAVFKWCRQSDMINPEAQRKWAELQASDPSIRMYLIWPDLAKAPVGVAGLTSIDLINRRAEFSLYIGPEGRGNAYGEKALRTLVSHGFSNMGLHLIWGESFEGNPAWEIFRKLGFKAEGVRRDFYFREGKFIGARHFSLLSSEWWSDPEYKKVQVAWLPAQSLQSPV